MNHQATQTNKLKGTLQAPCNAVPLRLLFWPEIITRPININKYIPANDPCFKQTAYDANSNKISQTDANGNVTQIVYDVLNRVDKRIDAEANVATNFYDANSNLILEVNERLFETKHEYDRLNRRTRTLDLGGYLTTFEYDKVGNPTTQTLPNSNVVTTVYDPLNRTTGTTDLLGAINTYSSDLNGKRLTIRRCK